MLASIFLLSICIGFYFIFQRITPGYFSGTGNMHIIDTHVKDCGIAGLFDGPYVAKAAAFYNKENYEHSFLILDTIFPVFYSLFIVSLSFAFRQRKWYPLVIVFIMAGALFDYAEDYSFFYYLYHPSERLADQVAFCTSIKSLLLPLNIITGLLLFICGMFLKEKPGRA
jgi:hypothetical protein